MLQFILAVALCAQQFAPPTDQQVLAQLPQTSAERTEVSITKSLVTTTQGSTWACVAYYTESQDGVSARRVHVVYLDAPSK